MKAALSLRSSTPRWQSREDCQPVPNVVTLTQAILEIQQWMQHYLTEYPPRKALRHHNIELVFTLECHLKLHQLLQLQKYASSLEFKSPLSLPAIVNYCENNLSSRVTISMPSLEHDMTALKVQENVRQQLWDGGNFYWGTWKTSGITAVDLLGPSQVTKVSQPNKKSRFRYPDGSFWIFDLQPDHPFFVVEVALGHEYDEGRAKCKEWMLAYKGKVRYAILVKIHKWPEEKKKKGQVKGKGKAVAEDTAAAQAEENDKAPAAENDSATAKGKRKATHDDSDSPPPAKRSKSRSVSRNSGFSVQPPEIEYDYNKEAEEEFDASDPDNTTDEEEDEGEDKEEAQERRRRRRKYKFDYVEVSVFKTCTKSTFETVIDRMEVWPKIPEQEWKFKWSDWYKNDKNPTKDNVNVVSFAFLNTFFETHPKMLRVQRLIESELSSLLISVNNR
ncbi:hypothetical protein K440DRAFT_665064 [Wilcoxina mikolae CBS 423.85]|nr:hypothetical protein K440DRAFT_665064 [Wilcoxina mikolae CBS 423.85]